ncbi:MAG: hypothetical protein ABFS19_06585 [Thermodesulfobacteriota bacterium]
MTIDPHSMCFGLSRDLDRKSMSIFLQLLGRPEFADLLSRRLSETDIESSVSFLTGLMKQYLDEDEYHEQFLLEPSPHK